MKPALSEKVFTSTLSFYKNKTKHNNSNNNQRFNAILLLDSFVKEEE